MKANHTIKESVYSLTRLKLLLSKHKDTHSQRQERIQKYGIKSTFAH